MYLIENVKGNNCISEHISILLTRFSGRSLSLSSLVDSRRMRIFEQQQVGIFFFLKKDLCVVERDFSLFIIVQIQ